MRARVTPVGRTREGNRFLRGALIESGLAAGAPNRRPSRPAICASNARAGTRKPSSPWGIRFSKSRTTSARGTTYHELGTDYFAARDRSGPSGVPCANSKRLATESRRGRLNTTYGSSATFSSARSARRVSSYGRAACAPRFARWNSERSADHKHTLDPHGACDPSTSLLHAGLGSLGPACDQLGVCRVTAQVSDWSRPVCSSTLLDSLRASPSQLGSCLRGENRDLRCLRLSHV